MRQTINQLSVPDVLRGRVTAVTSVFTAGGARLGQCESGPTAAWWGAEMAALVGGLVTVAPAVAALLPRDVRALETVGTVRRPARAPAGHLGADAHLTRPWRRSAPPERLGAAP